MKKFLTLAAIFTLVFTACEQPTDEVNSGGKLPSLTIRNESSYVLTDVKFSGISFAAPDSNDLPTSNQSVKQLAAEDLNKTGYITFTRKDIGIALRTEAISITDEDYTFTFTNNTPVEEQANSNNKNSLSQISFLSRVAVEWGGRAVAKNDTIPIGRTTTNIPTQAEFTLKNDGVGKLLFSENEPVKVSGDGADAFSVVQPSGSEIAPNSSLTFKINFNPQIEQTYTITVTVSSNDPGGNFAFTVTAIGDPPKPEAIVSYDNIIIPQLGTIDAGGVFITQSTLVTVVIRNTGHALLTLDTENITITGTDVAAFIQTTNPAASISVGNSTSFVIECKPTKEGENNATLTIPTNDDSCNPIIVYLKVTGNRGIPVLELSQDGNVISNNSLTPLDFGQVTVGTPKPLTFTIKNTGTIALELTGEPLIESSNDVFSIPAQPVNSTITPGYEVSFVLRYTPIAEGENTATITFMNNSNAMQFSFTVRGMGHIQKSQITVQHGNAAISPYGVSDYDTIAIGESKEIIFTIGNSGDANLTAVNDSWIQLTDNDAGLFTVIQRPSSGVTVAPNNTTTFSVRFSPEVTGTNFTATVQITTNSRDNDVFSFTVRGNSYEKKPQITVKEEETGTVIASNELYNFGEVLAGTTKDVTFTIGNSGEANLTFVEVNSNRVNLTENNAGYFSIYLQPSSNTIAPGAAITFRVRFSPAVIGTNFNALVQIKTNSLEDDVFSFRIEGDGRGYEIGDTGPGGGMIFFATGNQFKECSPELGTYSWPDARTTANNYRGGSFTDWRLPDRGELELMYQNLHRNGLGGFYGNAATFYISSTLDNYGDPWRLSFYRGEWANPSSSVLDRVRAIRSFSL